MNADALPGRSIGCDIAKGEGVEAELDAFVSRRHEQRVRAEGERQAEDMWAASERAYFACRDQENRLAWHEYHQAQAERLRRTVGPLIAFHEERAEKLCGEGGA